MRAINLIVAGLLICLSGAMLVFSNSDAIPLWVTWFVGPLLWYGGFGITLIGLITSVFRAAAAAQSRKDRAVVVEDTKVLRLSRLARPNVAPIGVIHEIPAMGGFIL